MICTDFPEKRFLADLPLLVRDQATLLAVLRM